MEQQSITNDTIMEQQATNKKKQTINGKQTILKPFDEIDIPPLSLILFKGRDFVSKTIRRAESIHANKAYERDYGSYSHVAVCVNYDVLRLDFLKDKGPCTLESTASGPIADDPNPNLATGSWRMGVQVRQLSALAKSYPGQIAILGLVNNPAVKKENESDEDYQKRIDHIAAVIEKFYHDKKDTLYQFNPIQLLASAFPKLRWLTYFGFTDDWAMCSDLTGQFYKALEIIDKKVDTKDILPQDFIFDPEHDIPIGTFTLPPIQIERV